MQLKDKVPQKPARTNALRDRIERTILWYIVDSKQGRNKKIAISAGYVPQEYKIITCVDCGKDVRVSARNTKTCRCQNSQKEHDKKRKREWKSQR